jgi:hypothetical protein
MAPSDCGVWLEWIDMGMTTDRNGSVVRVPAVRKIDVFREGDGGLLVLTVDGGLFSPLTGIGTVRYDRYEDAEIGARSVRVDVEAGRDPAVLVSMVKAGPAPFPWRFALFVVAGIVMGFALSGW